MKNRLILSAILFCCTLQLFAQNNPLVGTWEVVSMKGTGSDGSKISADGSEFKETKIITPTHYILITHRKQGDSLVFDKAIAGTVRIEGNKYIETPLYFSQEGTDKAKMDFTYKLEGDKFIQSGTITYPDGKVATLDALVFQKVEGNNYTDNPAIGTWNQLSSRGVDESGKQLWSHTNATHIRFQIVSPTHWMRISLKDDAFENAMGGTYTMEGDTMYPNFEMAPSHSATNMTITQRVEGDKLYWSGIAEGADGKIHVEDVFERVTDSTTNTTSTK